MMKKTLKTPMPKAEAASGTVPVRPIMTLSVIAHEHLAHLPDRDRDRQEQRGPGLPENGMHR